MGLLGDIFSFFVPGVESEADQQRNKGRQQEESGWSFFGSSPEQAKKDAENRNCSNCMYFNKKGHLKGYGDSWYNVCASPRRTSERNIEPPEIINGVKCFSYYSKIDSVEKNCPYFYPGYYSE